MASVHAHEEQVHAKWLAADEWTAIRAQIVRKRWLSERLAEIGGRLTLAAERGHLARLPGLRNGTCGLRTSIFVIAGSTSDALAGTLEALRTQDADPNSFEAIVLDPHAPVDHGDDSYDVSMDATVQHTHAPYLLRYFPAERHPRQKRPDAATPAEGQHARSAAPPVDAERRWFEHYIRGLLLEKPLAPVAVTLEAGQNPKASFVSAIASAVSC